MSARTEHAESDPRHHTGNIRDMLEDLITRVREDVRKVDDSRAETLFETTAEILGGLVTACEHFDQKAEEAWRS